MTAAMRALCLVLLLGLFGPVVEAKQPRSAAARAEFVRENPCPLTGKRRGACPGWEVDHRIALKCGGADRPQNMQWLTVAQHREKTRREARWCRKRR